MKYIELIIRIWSKVDVMRKIIAVISLAMFFLTPVSASAVTLEKVLYSQLPAGKLQVNLKLSGQTNEPKVFSTQKPARIVFDFFGLDLDLEKTQYKIGQGSVDSLNVVKVADRVRVVINLIQRATYTSRFENNQFIINVDKALENSAKQGVVSAEPFSRKDGLVSNNKDLTNIDFRRTQKGGGSVIVNLSDPSIAIDLIDRGSEIVVDFQSTNLARDLEKRLDVTDFATPVRAVDLFQNGDNVRLIIEPSGKYQQLSFQKGNLFTVILDPIDEIEVKKEEGDENGFSGERLTLNFQRLEVRSALSVIADFTGINIVASDDVDGELTLNLKDVPWDQALEVILETKGLAKRQKGNVIWIAPASKIADFERKQLEASNASKALEPVISEVVEINYATAKDIRDVILSESGSASDGEGESNQQVVFLQSSGDSAESSKDDQSSSGSLRVTADDRTNSLIVTTTVSNMRSIKALIAELDKPVRQVVVETRIVQANDTFSKELGARFGFQRILENTQASGSNVGTTSTSGTLGGSNALQQSLLNGQNVFGAGASAPVNSDLGATGINGLSSCQR